MQNIKSTAAARFRATLSFINEVIHYRRSVKLWPVGTTKLFIEEETLEDSVACICEHTHEYGSYQESNDAGNHTREVRRRYFVCEVGPLSEHNVSDESCGTYDEEPSDEHEHCSDGVGDSEPECVLNHQQETVPCRPTEVLASQGYLDVGVLSEELDASLEACKEV